MSNYFVQLIDEYERDIRGNIYSFQLSDGVTVEFSIKSKNVPHLLGIEKLPLRQTKGKHAGELYSILKNGYITLDDVAALPNHKEEYKKIKNFHHIISILHCGDAVKVVKKRGALNSQYLFYLDHSPKQIVHLGIAWDLQHAIWYPESLLILNDHVTAYVKDQLPVDIINMSVKARNEHGCVELVYT